MRRPAFLGLLAILLVAVVAGGWLLLGRGDGASRSPAASIPPVPPSTEVTADGRAVPARYAELGVATPGTVAAVLVAPGDRVKAGDPLVRLDATSAQADVDGARAAVTAAEATAAQAAAGVTQAEAGVAQAQAGVAGAQAGVNRANAARDALPSGTPSSRKRIADADVAAARAALDGAQGALRGARAAVTGAQKSQAAADADVTRAKAAGAAAEDALAQRTLSAPFDGTVASLDARVGERVAPGLALVRVADASGWRIETTNLDETTVARVTVGAPVRITFDGLPGVTLDGRVTSVDLFGASSQGNIVYRAVVTPATLPDGLRWNMTATITVQAGP
jgi:multidrug resistance efflux pump